MRRLGPREAMQLVREREAPEVAAALVDAGERYADDDGSREIADIQAGRHPLQQGGRGLDAGTHFEEKLSAIRARRGG